MSDGKASVVVGGHSSTPRRSARSRWPDALGAKGGAEQLTRLVVPSLPVASVLAVGLGKARDEYPADVVRRAAGVAARSLSGTETVITTLSELDLAATIEGLVLGAYRFSDFRSDKTAPTEAG